MDALLWASKSKVPFTPIINLGCLEGELITG